jgi:formylmethanofuran dehydrogenase subunit E
MNTASQQQNYTSQRCPKCGAKTAEQIDIYGNTYTTCIECSYGYKTPTLLSDSSQISMETYE